MDQAPPGCATAAVLALIIQHQLDRTPLGGDLFKFRGGGGSPAKIIWRRAICLSHYTQRTARGWFFWPTASDGMVAFDLGGAVIQA